MRRIAFYLLIAFIAFSFSAFIAIESNRPEVCILPPQKDIFLQPPTITDESFSATYSITEQNPIPKIPATIKRELDKRFPDWRFPKIDSQISKFLREHNSPNTHPAFISGDFDGNGQMDYFALIEFGTDSPNFDVPLGTHTVYIAFLKKGNKFKFYQLGIKFYKIESTEYIALIRKGEKGYDYETGKNFIYKTDAIFSGYWEKAGSSYVYENGKFREITTSD